MGRASPHTPRTPAAVWILLGACLALRLALLAIDAQPRFFLGDSESYLATRVGGWMPPDRSWLYGLAASGLVDAADRLGALILVQSVLTAGAIAMLGGVLLRAGLARWAVAALVLALSTDPLLLYYDRAVLTDSPGGAILTAGVALALLALRADSRQLALAAGFLLALAVSLRTALLPPVLWAAAVGLVIAMPRRRHSAPGTGPSRPRRAGLALAVTTIASLGVWAVVNGKATGRPPALNPNAGFFLLGAVAPMLQPEDFAGTGVGDARALLDATHHRDRVMRNAQLYGPDEIADRLKRHFGSERQAADAAGSAARAAIRRDPAGFARLAIVQSCEYFDSDLYRQNFAIWAGLDRPLSEGTVARLREAVDDAPAPEAVSLRSFALEYFEATLGYLPLLAWMALALPALCAARLPFAAHADRAGLVLVAGATLAYVAGIFVFSAEMVPRYLLPLVPLLALGAGLLAASTPPRRRGARTSAT